MKKTFNLSIVPHLPTNLFLPSYPALLYGLLALLGSTMALKTYLWPAFLVTTLLLLAIQPKDRSGLIRIFFGAILCFSCFLLTTTRLQFPHSSALDIKGKAEIEITAISNSTTPFGPIWVYKATLISFKDDQNHTLAKNIPVKIRLPGGNNFSRPLATHRYQVNGKLKENSAKRYSLSISKKAIWIPLESKWNLTEWRYSAKTNLQNHLQNAIKDRHVTSFLIGIATGEFDDLQLSTELGRFGLQHLMAISGLHFSILATCIGFFLCLFFSIRIVTLGVIFLLSGYFIFLGNSPSILRAWISLTIMLGGIYLGKRSSPLNSLGIALFFIALFDPLLVFHIGFQFSFGITAAILCWSKYSDEKMKLMFPKRSLSQMSELPSLQQYAYCLLCFLRQTLALAFAVNLVALPLTLFHFQKFPFMGLIYNLFFPFLVSATLLLLLVACATSLLFPWLAQFLHSLNERYTQFLLDFAFKLPRTFDGALYISEISTMAILVYIITIFILGLYVKQKDIVSSHKPEWMI